MTGLSLVEAKKKSLALPESSANAVLFLTDSSRTKNFNVYDNMLCITFLLTLGFSLEDWIRFKMAKSILPSSRL